MTRPIAIAFSLLLAAATGLARQTDAVVRSVFITATDGKGAAAADLSP